MIPIDDEHSGLIQPVRDVIQDYISPIYPNAIGWFNRQVLPNLLNHTRELYVRMDEDIIKGILIIKLGYDAKICTLWVKPEYTRRGIGTSFMEKASHRLGVSPPPIHIHIDKYPVLAEFLRVSGYTNFTSLPSSNDLIFR